MQIKLFLLLVFVEVLSVIFLSWTIYNGKKGISINFYSNENMADSKFTLQTSSELKYFYEPIANSKQSVPNEVDWADKTIIYTINSDALNNEEVDMNDQRRNIVVLGDSFTYGLFVQREANYVSILEKMLQKGVNKNIQLINLGVPGYDIQYSSERFRIRGIKYNPALVVWLLKDDDFSTLNEISQPIIELYKKKFLENNSSEDLRKIIPGKFMPIWEEQSLIEEVKRMGGSVNLSKKQYSALTELRKYYSGPILIGGLGLSSDYQALISRFIHLNYGIYYVELPNIWGNKKNYFPDLHPNALGHKMIANSFYKAIYNNGVICGKLSPNLWFKF